jgi:general secretion pathway protein D
MEVSTALRESINLTPDIRTNTIIVKAPSDSMGLLLDMIRDLDESSVGSKKVRIFKLENADAAAMGKMLTDLFRLGQGDDLLVLKPRESVQVADLGGGMIEESANFSGTELTAVPDPRQQLAIVSGTPAYLELVSSVIDELDAIDGNERETFLYQLRNATATSVADVLGDFVETEQQKLIETIGVQQLGSAARLLEREITIRGDDKSNSVLVSASPRYMTRIKEVIKELDVDPPQVLIQVLLAEVTLSGGVDWGVDMSNPGGSFAFDMSLAAFPAGIAGGLPSMTLGISDFSIVLKALENQGRLNILSNPSIIAANNEPATINVGEIIYVPTGAQTFNTGLTSVPLQEKEIGVILSVTPSINPDGYVRMQVEPTLSKLSAQKDQPAVGVETPRIIQRTANTTVTVRDGQTIVIGGLINESYEYQVDKIPILGDIPLIGLLFRSEYEELIRTELVIVLTPHVITSPAAFDRIEELTSRQVDRITLPDELLDQIKDGEIEGMGLFKTDGYTLELQDLEKAIAPEAAEEAPAP